MESEKLKKSVEDGGDKETLEIKAHKRRWIIISIFIVYAAINSFQWTEYSIISNLVVKYYNVSPASVEWTSIVYMALYPFLVAPVCYLIDKKGLRIAGLIGCLGTALGVAVKLFSIRPDLFYVVLIGQALESASQVFIVSLPTMIAGVWFKANEVSTACALCVIGTQLGCALGFVFPPVIVKDHENISDIGSDLNVMCWILMGFVIPAAVTIIFYFPKYPPNPPNPAQLKERSNPREVTFASYMDSLRVLLQNRGFLIHFVAFGVNMGVLSSVGTLMNQLVLHYFMNSQEDAGRMGSVMIFTGIVGALVVGIILDKTHKYKECTILLYAVNTISLIAFMYSLEFKSKLFAYISIAFTGLCCNAYNAVAFEVAAELTYPSPESTTIGLLFASSQLFGTVTSYLGGIQIRSMGVFWTLAVQSVLLAIGTVITVFVPNKLRRQDALKQTSLENTEDVMCIKH